MKVTQLEIPDILLIKLVQHSDDRGFFQETYRRSEYALAGIKPAFIQDNRTRSSQGTLRGLHFQLPNPQGKLVQVLGGSVYDVVVDMRSSSPTNRNWVAVVLDAEDHVQLWIPPGFAHGFYVLSPEADVSYKVTRYYDPEAEHVLIWDDPELGIPWPIPKGEKPLVSDKDAHGQPLRHCDLYPAEDLG